MLKERPHSLNTYKWYPFACKVLQDIHYLTTYVERCMLHHACTLNLKVLTAHRDRAKMLTCVFYFLPKTDKSVATFDRGKVSNSKLVTSKR